MAVKYTTATKVKAMIGDQILAVTVDADIEVWIEEAEGLIDTWLKIGSGDNANSLTFSATKKPHLVLEMCATALSAFIAISSASASVSTMESLVNMQEVCWATYQECKTAILADGGFILDQ